MGGSKSTVLSVQEAEQQLQQSYKGTCNISCTNVMNNTTIDIENTTINGGITITQVCSVDANCAISSTMDISASIFFSAKNSAGASPAWGLLTGYAPNVDLSSISSYQEMRQQLSQNVMETCKVSSTNEMNNLTIFMNNDVINGGLQIDQSGNITGGCALSNSMQMAATATGLVTNNAQAGKKAKPSLEWGIYVIVGIGAAIAIFVIVSALHGKPTGTPKSKNEETSIPQSATSLLPSATEMEEIA